MDKSPSDTTDLDEFEASYKAKSTKGLSSVVQTKFESTDLTMKMARVKANIVSGTARIEFQIPGIPGVGERSIAGGYGFLDTYDPDDFMTARVEDLDRMIAWGVALAIDPGATEPVNDAFVQAMGQYPAYPVVGSYTDDDAPIESQGWYFWPCAMGNNLPPVGEIEVEPLGFYGSVTSGLYLVFEVTRPNVSDGVLRADLWLGRYE